MKALSIRQPWAHAIMELGKDIENRDWPTTFRGRIYVHASRRWTREEQTDCDVVEEILGRKVDRGEPNLGGIIGTVEIVDCVKQSDSPWFFGQYGFVLANPVPIDFIPCRGRLGFFEPNI